VKLPLLTYIVLVTQCGVALVGGFRYKNLPQPLRILEWLTIFNVGMVCIEWALATFHIYNLWMSHFSTMIELTAVVFIYAFWMKQRRDQRVLYVCLLIFAILWTVSKFSIEPFSVADDWTSAISKVMEITFSGYLLLNVVKESDMIWTNDPRIWVTTGVIIYSAGSLFLFALFNKMLQISPAYLLNLWSVNWVLIIVSYLLFAKAFLCKK
jgi:hypothetical protein